VRYECGRMALAAAGCALASGGSNFPAFKIALWPSASETILRDADRCISRLSSAPPTACRPPDRIAVTRPNPRPYIGKGHGGRSRNSPPEGYQRRSSRNSGSARAKRISGKMDWRENTPRPVRRRQFSGVSALAHTGNSAPLGGCNRGTNPPDRSPR